MIIFHPWRKIFPGYCGAPRTTPDAFFTRSLQFAVMQKKVGDNTDNAESRNTDDPGLRSGMVRGAIWECVKAPRY